MATETAKQRAACLMALGQLSYRKVAEAAPCALSTLQKWLVDDDFRAQVESERAVILASVRDRGIADMHNRLQRQDIDRERLRQLVAERSEYWTQRLSDVTTELAELTTRIGTLDPGTEDHAAAVARIAALNRDPAHYPGITLGLTLYRQVPMRFGTSDEFETDTATLGELRALESIVEKSLGQTEPSRRLNDDDLTKITDSELVARAAAAFGGALTTPSSSE